MPPTLAVLTASCPVVVAVVAVLARRRGGALSRRLGLLATSMGLLAVGFAGFHLQWALQGRAPAPSLAEPFLLGGYLVLVAAWWPRLRGDDPGSGASDRATLLDAVLVVVGPAAVVAAVVVDPVLQGHSAAHLAVLVAYPLLDLVALTCVVHGALSGLLGRWQAVVLAVGVLGLLLADCLFFLFLQVDVAADAWVAALAYAVAFLGFAAGAAAPAPRQHDAPLLPWSVRRPPPPRRRLVLVSVSSCLPVTALVLGGAAGADVDWAVLGTGALVTAVVSAVRLHWALTASQAQTQALDRLARYDELTGLPNRRELVIALHRALEDDDAQVVVAVLDLDHFKRVNDTGGHAAGDRLLREATRAWQAHLPPTARLYRWGGEEFVAVFLDTPTAVAERALEASRSATPAPHTVSVGIAVRRPREAGADLLVRADQNLYRAKGAGRDRLHRDDGAVLSRR